MCQPVVPAFSVGAVAKLVVFWRVLRRCAVHSETGLTFLQIQARFNWLRGRDLNPRPLGYEPNELPDCSTPRQEENNLTTPLGFDQPDLDEKLNAGSPLDRSRHLCRPTSSPVNSAPAVIAMRSLRTAAATAVSGLIVIGSTAPGAERQPAPAEPIRSRSPLRISVDLVQIDATVTDQNGRHVTNLGAADFEVLQDNRPQTISCGSHCATLAPVASARPASSSTCRIWASCS